MNKGFFTSLIETGIKDVQISVKQTNDNLITVLVSPKSTSQDDSVKLRKPIIFTDTAENIDAGFFESVTPLLGAAQKSFNNIEQYEAQAKEAEKQSKIEKDKKAAEKKQLEEFEKKLKKAVDAYEDFVKSEGYDQVKDKNKTIKFLNSILEIKPDYTKYKNLKKDIAFGNSLFDTLS